MSYLRYVHWVATKHVLRFLHGIVCYGLRYTFVGCMRLFDYTYLDWARSAVDQKSTSSYCFNMGSTMISWSRKKQGLAELSTIKAEYIATSDANKESIWICNLLVGLVQDVLEMKIIHCDNQIYVKLSENPANHDRSKNIEMQYHYLEDMFQKGTI